MRILLISPPFYRIIGFYNRYFPYGITVLGTVLAHNQHQVKIYDADFYENPKNIDYARLPEKYPSYLKSFTDKEHHVWREARQTIADFKPGIVGISVFTTFAASAFYVAQITKELFPSCPVIFGGPHATVKPEEILQISPHVDYVVRGEGELTLQELVQCLETGSPHLTAIDGLSMREPSGIRHNKERASVRDIDTIPIPDRGLLMNEKKYSPEDMGMIMTSRGCPYNCTYCASSKRVSYRSPDNVLEEIMMVHGKYRTTQFTFKDDSFTVNRKRVEELCHKILQKKLHINWECNTRADLIDGALLNLMKKSGCNFIKIGIESGSEKILGAMNKKISLSLSRKIAPMLRKSGIHWTGYFLIGVPGETVEDINKTVQFMRELNPDTALLGVYEPFPGTVMFEDGIRRKLVKKDMRLEDFYATSPNNYYKADPHIQTDTIAPDTFAEIEKQAKKIFHRHNVGLKKVFKAALSRSKAYIKEPVLLAGDIKKFLAYTFSSP